MTLTAYGGKTRLLKLEKYIFIVITPRSTDWVVVPVGFSSMSQMDPF